MTRKHFVLIADAIHDCNISRESREIVVNALIRALKTTNDNFDPFRFRAACMGEQKSVE